MGRTGWMWWVLVGLGAWSTRALAQAPKPGDFYEDAVDLGFKIKMPDGWDFIPARPEEVNLIGHYEAPNKSGILSPGTSSYWSYQAWLVRFDRRDKAKDGTGPRYTRTPAKDIQGWLEAGGVAMPGWKLESTKPLAPIGKIEALEYQFTSKFGAEVPVRLYAVLFKRLPEVDVAVVFNGPGEDKKWSKFEGAFKTMAKSFKPLELAASGAEPSAAGKTLRDAKRKRLEEEVQRSPGWKLYETPNYFIISNNSDEQFVEELMERLEAIRLVYEETYPPSLATELRELAERAAVASEKEGEGGGEEEGEPVEPASTTVQENPLERARSSVVRVCGNREQYMNYGGPPNSAGYFSPNAEELVVFDDKAVLGRSATWGTLNHEAFHQYIFCFFGNLSPHSWYNEGHGDFYGGYEYKHKKFNLTRYEKRVGDIQQAIRDEMEVPLREIVSWTQDEYYDRANNMRRAGQNYAQGWSMVYFLRTGAKNAKGWSPAWGSILDVYLRTLVETNDLDQAVEKAFAGVDWDVLEACWKEYTMQ